MSEAALLRVLADRIDELDALKLFPADVTEPGEVRVEWTASSDHPGYAAMSEAISAVVEQHWNALRAQVVKKKEADVQGARKAWSDFGGEAPAAEATTPIGDALVTNGPASRVQLMARQA